jgi:hypothetical protein
MFIPRHLLLLGLALCLSLAASTACKAQAFTDPEKAGPDFEVQGEYLEKLTVEARSPHGAQVIALGDGKFDLVIYQGGLPGEGWRRGGGLEKATGESSDGVTKFKTKSGTATIKGGVLTLAGADGGKQFELKKVARQSPTLGAKPPEGATVLFDGSSAENFNNGKIVEENLLAASNCESKQKFGDHSLHIEFRTPYMPKARGQGRGNSGVYPQSRYEVQVLDSFGLDGKDNECGGIYSINPPIVNMCFPPLSWQTYDIDFTAARFDDSGKKITNGRITVRHNGVVIHDDQELAHGTPGRHAEGPGPDALFMQDHGNPVVFRNIWVVEKK